MGLLSKFCNINGVSKQNQRLLGKYIPRNKQTTKFNQEEFTYTQWDITQPLKRIHLNQFYKVDETGAYYRVK